VVIVILIMASSALAAYEAVTGWCTRSGYRT